MTAISFAAQIATVNPTTGTLLRTYNAHTVQQIEEIVAAVHSVQPAWAALSVASRVGYLSSLAAQLRADRTALAQLAVQEMGKPISEALAEVDKCVGMCEYYVTTGSQALAPLQVMSRAPRSWIAHEPLGVVLAVMPWNFPYWQVMRFAIPTLLAGNVGLLKHAPNVTGCALAIERLFADAGLPVDILRTLLVAESDVPETVAALIADERVAAVTLTGSERAGAVVASHAGRAVKKSVLELGGSDPFIVLDDAVVPLAVAAAVKSRFLNAGQSCMAAKRFIVHRAVADEFVTCFAAAVDALAVGDPAHYATSIGPLARKDLVEALEQQVNASVVSGATVRTGGNRLEGPGFWYAPTVLGDAAEGMPVMTEETFGPVAAVTEVSDDEEAVEVANATRYGLGASIWSRDIERSLTLGRSITSGALFVNAVPLSDARLPFGGTKHSGYGRELSSEGVLEFTNTRTYLVGAWAPPTIPPQESS